MRKGRKWTFSGIKRYYPNLSYETWLKICRNGYHYGKTLPKIP